MNKPTFYCPKCSEEKTVDEVIMVGTDEIPVVSKEMGTRHSEKIIVGARALYKCKECGFVVEWSNSKDSQ